MNYDFFILNGWCCECDIPTPTIQVGEGLFLCVKCLQSLKEELEQEIARFKDEKPEK